MYFLLLLCCHVSTIIPGAQTAGSTTVLKEYHDSVPPTRDTGTIFVFTDQPPAFPGGDPALDDYLRANLHYPAKAKEEKISGTCFVQFIVDREGHVWEPKIVGKPHPYLDDEALRVISAMPAWEPGRQKGEPVNVRFNLPIQFTLDAGSLFTTQGLPPMMENSATLYTDGKRATPATGDHPPIFPGGEAALSHFLQANRTYPKPALARHVSGTVTAVFVISKSGAVTKPKIISDPLPLLDDEVLRLIDLMPNWQPAVHDGKPVPAVYQLSLPFVIAPKPQ